MQKRNAFTKPILSFMMIASLLSAQNKKNTMAKKSAWILSDRLNIILWVFLLMTTMISTSCSHDDEGVQDKTVYHRSYVLGDVNGKKVSMDYVNSNIPYRETDYGIYSNDTGNDKVYRFNWELKLYQTKDSVVLLHLYVSNISMNEARIYKPDINGHIDGDKITAGSTCYVTVDDLKRKTTKFYHPTEQQPVIASWKVFTLNYYEHSIQHNKGIGTPTSTFERNYESQWYGLDGNIYGTLTCDDTPASTLSFKLDFILF